MYCDRQYSIGIINIFVNDHVADIGVLYIPSAFLGDTYTSQMVIKTPLASGVL